MRVVTIVAFLLGQFFVQAPAYAGPEDIAVVDLDLVSSRRVGRTVNEYVYRVQLDNSGGPLSNVVGTASSASAATTVIEPTVNVGDLAAGPTTPTDTFTLRHNRRYRFNPANITWVFTGEEVAQNQAPSADAGADQTVGVGDTVALDGSGSADPDSDPLSYAWSLQVPAGSSATLSDSTEVTPSFVADVAGIYEATLLVDDTDLSDTDTVTITAEAAGGENPPLITSDPILIGSSGDAYAYDVQATDPDAGDVLTYSLQLAPNGMSIDASTGLITWTPTVTGAFDVDVLVTDLGGLTARQIYLITVNLGEGDQPPTMDPIPNQTVVVGQTLMLTTTGSDPEGEALFFGLQSAPEGVALNPTSGLFEWTPTPAQVGTAVVTVSVRDPGGQSDASSFDVTVLSESVNNAPMIAEVEDQTINALSTLNLSLSATDPDADDILTFSLSGAPAGLQFDAPSGNITWSPGTSDAGTSDLTATVTDSFGDTASTSFSITVVEPPVPPVAVDDAYTVRHRELLNVPAPGVLANDTDANNDVLTAQDTSAPSLGSLDAFDSDGSFQYSPPPIPPIDVGLAEQCQTAVLEGSSRSQNVSVADVDADGNVEILVIGTVGTGGDQRGINLVYDGATCAQKPIGGEWVDVNADSYGVTFGGGFATLVNLDADPELEIVTSYGGASDFLVEPVGARARFLALNLDGTPVWGTSGASEELSLNLAASSYANLSPSAVDLDGDGDIELVVALNRTNSGLGPGIFAYDASTGAVLWEYISPRMGNLISSQASHWVIADIDLDGTVEILFGDSVLDHNGQLEFRLPQQTNDTFPNYMNMAVVNVDNDPFAEILAVDIDGHTLFNHDGSVIWRTTRLQGGTLFGGVTIAELDGDANPEYVVHEGYIFENGASTLSYNLAAFNAEDGSVLWTHENTDYVYTFLAGAETSTVPVAFDVDRDGLDELILNLGSVNEPDAQRIYIFNSDGTERARDSLISQGDTRENGYLTIADIDGDGAAEIVQKLRIPFDETVRVLEGTVGNPLPPARRLRNQWLAHPTQVAEDASIPTYIQPQWLIPGLNKFNVASVIPGEDESARDAFNYIANDGNADSNEATVNIAIATVNAPTIVSRPPLGASPGFEYTYPAFATDADFGDTLTWSFADAPVGMSVDGFGIVTWTPQAGDLGDQRVMLIVTDNDGNTDAQDFTVEVQPPSTVPDVLGDAESDATEAIESAGLAVGSVTQNYSLTVPAGQVISQSVAGGQQAGSGSFIDYVISLGPPPIFAPTLTNLNTSTAMTELQAIGLELGEITNANSNTVPKGLIVSQSQAPNTQLVLGDAVDVVVSSGPALQVRVVEPFVQAGGSAAVSIDVFDTAGSPVSPLPPFSILVTSLDGATGSLPTAAGSTINTSSDTRGAFQALVDVPGFGSQTLGLVVRGSFNSESYLAPVSAFAGSVADSARILGDLQDALNEGDLLQAQLFAQQLITVRDAIDEEDLGLRNPFVPEQGFLPSLADASAAGFGPGVEILAAGQIALMQLNNAYADVDGYITQLNPARARNDDVRAAAINDALRTASQTLLNLNLPTGTQLALNGDIHGVLARTIPTRVKRDLDFIINLLAENGIANASQDQGARFIASGGASIDGFYADARATFFTLGGQLSGMKIRMDIINNFYMDYVTRVVSSAAILAEADLLEDSLAPVPLTALITAGTTVSFQIFDVPSSIIEGIGFTQNRGAFDVTVIGPDLIESLLSDLADVEAPSNAREALELAMQIKDAFGNATTAGLKTPNVNAVYRGCFFDSNPDCRQLVIGAGIPIVHSNGPFPGAVLVAVQDVVTGQLYTGVYAFIPKML